MSHKDFVMQDYTTPLPSYYYIDTCNLCNLRCPFCHTGSGKGTAKSGVMKFEDFVTIFDKIADKAEFIGLYNYGEPFMNPNILQMVKMVADRGIVTRIDSNLTLNDFSDAEAEEVIKSGLTVLSASIDGASQWSYEKYRIKGDFQRAITNLERLQAAKKRLTSPTPVLSWSFLINSFNEIEVEIALQKARGLGVEINFSLMDVREDPEWRSSYHSAPEKLQALRDRAAPTQEVKPTISQIVRGFLKRFRKVKAPKGLPMAVDALVLPSCFPHWCKQPFYHMTISWNGDVYPCCVVHNSNMVMGNLVESSLEEVWNNENFKNSRAFLHNNKRGYESSCERCVIGR